MRPVRSSNSKCMHAASAPRSVSLTAAPAYPRANARKVFEPFYRIAGSAGAGQGVGYGLALVRRIARLHGGDARCLPRQGGGACFAVSVGQVLPEQG